MQLTSDKYHIHKPAFHHAGIKTAATSGFTLIEVIASVIILSLLITSVLMTYRRTLDSVIRYSMRERAITVAQRHMESLLTTLEEPNSTTGIATRDDLDPDFLWQMDLERISIDSSAPKTDLSNTVIQASVKVKPAVPDKNQKSREVELVRYFAMLKPLPGHAVAVPLTPDEPDWYLELKAKLGREPTAMEILQYFIEIGDLPADMAEELDNLDIDMEDEFEDLEELDIEE
ncbi:MAG: type II secretion system protein [Sedimentisphaerales bacterium]|nr:type II secretion system protein [Sedimentisphaerales bacterium]